MMGQRSVAVFLIGAAVVCLSLVLPERDVLADEERVAHILSKLGEDAFEHFPNSSIRNVSAAIGEDIVKKGFSSRPGIGKSKRQSKHFVCTSCHNLDREDPDLSVSDPEARLKYTALKGLPFLQATSLYGVVNRETFYNGDYEKKYGDLVDAARNDLRGAIQLCATECAQGRPLKSWEMESVLAFLWTLDLKIHDLNLSGEEMNLINNAQQTKTGQDSAIALIKSKYLQGSPATFGEINHENLKKPVSTGNPNNGKLIYENSCLHCHQNRRYSYLLLDDSKMTFKHLSNKSDGYGRHSIYQVVRYGVFSKSGKESYMPQYPLEKLSDDQLEDLRAYIELKAS